MPQMPILPVLPADMRTDHAFSATALNHAVAADDIVIAHHMPAPVTVHLVDVLHRQVQVRAGAE